MKSKWACKTAGDAHCGLPGEQRDHRALCRAPWGSARVGPAGDRVGFSKEISGRAPMRMHEKLLVGVGIKRKLSPF